MVWSRRKRGVVTEEGLEIGAHAFVRGAGADAQLVADLGEGDAVLAAVEWVRPFPSGRRSAGATTHADGWGIEADGVSGGEPAFDAFDLYEHVDDSVPRTVEVLVGPEGVVQRLESHELEEALVDRVGLGMGEAALYGFVGAAAVRVAETLGDLDERRAVASQHHRFAVAAGDGERFGAELSLGASSFLGRIGHVSIMATSGRWVDPASRKCRETDSRRGREEGPNFLPMRFPTRPNFGG